MTDGGVNTTVTTFTHKGRQMIVVHAGGDAFSGGKRGDGVWAFSLDGTLLSGGKGTAMPAFRGVYTSDQLRDIAGYISTTLAAAKRK